MRGEVASGRRKLREVDTGRGKLPECSGNLIARGEVVKVRGEFAPRVGLPRCVGKVNIGRIGPSSHTGSSLEEK